MNLNASPSPFPIEQISPSFQVASSSSLSCHIFIGTTQDQTGYHQKDDDYAYHGGSSSCNYAIKNKVNNGLKLTLWNKKEEIEHTEIATKMNNKPKINRAMNKYWEDQKLQPSDLRSNISSYNNNSPIRVCADCNTTKTPLWRSGPKGPKSLCNACGIRQRKARRAMAAAASGAVVTANQPPTPTSVKIKVLQHKVKTSKNVHFKKRLKMAEGSSNSNGKKKIDFEDFLINLSNNLTFHRVFPEEEKDAAILLMALSSGLVHG